LFSILIYYIYRRNATENCIKTHNIIAWNIKMHKNIQFYVDKC